MPKKKKTRKQKIIADARHKIAVNQSAKVARSASEPSINYEPHVQLAQDTVASTQTIIASRFQYLRSDLIKTIVLTILIIAGELVLSYFFI